jgi:hypothetical protein
MEADGFMYGIGIFSDVETDSQESDITEISSVVSVSAFVWY